MRFALVFMGGLVLLIARWANHAQNYPETNYPVYSGNLTAEDLEPTGELTVVSYNIRYSLNIDQAVLELKEFQDQREVDIILLQEMDEVGVEHIARALNFNYVYIPAAVEPRYRQNTGNAILSRWPITASAKLILPHNGLSSGMNRTATKAIIQIDDADILVYSIHAETKFTLPSFRENQYRAILEDVDREAEFVIVGGDFNSVTSADITRIEEMYRRAGFMRATRHSGHTVEKFKMRVTADHIFSKGFNVQQDGKFDEATASDHLPIWARLSF